MTEIIEDCTPAQAYKEYVEHPATGTLTITVASPDYVPATEGYEVVKDKKLKWVWTGGPVEGAPESPLVNPSGWLTVGETNDKKGQENPDVVLDASGGKGNADWFFYQTQVEWVPGKPAVGEPTKEIKNPDYVPAWTEVIVHEGVWCPVDTESAVGAEPVAVVGAPEPVVGRDVLATTGFDLTGLALVAALLVAGGAVLIRKAARR